MSEVLRSYTQEIMPKIRSLTEKKEELKAYLEENQDVLRLKNNVKAAQEELKLLYETDDTIKSLRDEIKDWNTEISEAIKGAARATKDTTNPFKSKQLKDYYYARAKEEKDVVVTTILKGRTFDQLNKLID
jgi:chromosome segregation ATPase